MWLLRPWLQDDRFALMKTIPKNPPVFCQIADDVRLCSVQLISVRKFCYSGWSYPVALRANKENSHRQSVCALATAAVIINNRSCLCFNFKENFQSLVRQAAFASVVAALKKWDASCAAVKKPPWLSSFLALTNWDNQRSTSCIVPWKTK